MIIKRTTYEKRISDAAEAGKAEGIDTGYNRGYGAGYSQALIDMLKNNTIIHKKGEGYGSCKKIEVDLDDADSVAGAVEEIANERV